MSSLVKKTIKGQQYYYIVDSQRVDGKPRIVNQLYLGSVESVIDRLKESKGAVSPVYSSVFDFGDVAALYDVAERLGIVKLIDDIAPKRNQGISIGSYLLIAAINRAVNPTSKANIEQWYTKTILQKILPVPKKQLSSQRFWDNMNIWTEEKILKFEEVFVSFIVQQYNLPIKCLVYDATNFFTYIDTDNGKAEIAQRGHSKEKRNDLRIVGLSMMLSAEDEIPLFYEVYKGNTPDSKQFAQAVRKLKEQYRSVFGQEADVTLVFDRGNNSQDNISLLEEGNVKFHYVGGLKRNQCKGLYEIPKEDYQKLHGDEFGDTSAFQTKFQAFGKEMTAVITHNPKLTHGQLKGILRNRAKCREKLKELQENLEQWETGIKKKGKRPTKESIQKKIAAILATEYMEELFVIKWDESKRLPAFSFTMPESRLLELEERELGKTVLFTNREGWSNEKIVQTYRSAWRIESAFRQMKNTDHLSVRPMWHWTDQKIKVHIFYCVLAYRLCCILKRELRENGIDLSINRILEMLGDKQQLVHYYQQKRGLRENYSMTKCDEITEQIIKVQHLEKYQLKS